MAGLLTTVTPVKLSPEAWQVAQPLVIPAWFIGVPGPNAEKFVGEWQVSQANSVGICATGFPVAVVPAWHVPQLPGAMPA